MVRAMLAIRPWSQYIFGYYDRKKGYLALIIPAFLPMIKDKEGACLYNQLHIVVSPDIWHQKMGHIGLLGLYKLEKECLGVQL